MTGIADYLGTLTANPIAFIVSAVVFVVVFGAVLAVGLRFVSPRKTDRAGLPPNLRAQSPPDRASGSAGAAVSDSVAAGSIVSADDPAMPASRSNRGSDFRDTLVTIHKILSALIVLALVTITVAIYFATQPGDGSRLAFWVFAVATALAAMHLHSATKRYGSREEDAELHAHFRRSVQATLSDKIAAALLSKGQVQWNIESPQVHSIDQDRLDRARSMAAAGESMDEICRAIEPAYDGWTDPHRQAYRNVMSAAIDHSA